MGISAGRARPYDPGTANGKESGPGRRPCDANRLLVSAWAGEVPTIVNPTIRFAEPIFLVDASAGSALSGTGGRALEPGYYVVLRRIEKGPGGFVRTLRYFGPFATPVAARLLLTSAAALGIVASPAQLVAADGAAAAPAHQESRPLASLPPGRGDAPRATPLGLGTRQRTQRRGGTRCADAAGGGGRMA